MTDQTSVNKDTVLVVEDTAANHDVIRAFLNDIDVCCESVYDGMEAVTACGDADPSHYALILMDINLPHMNGYQTAEKLRDMGVLAPIMAVTASGEDELEKEHAALFFDAVLRKPFNSTEFFAAIAPYIKNAASCSLASRPLANSGDALSSIDDQVCDVSRGIANMGNSLRLFTKHFNNFKRNNADLEVRMRSLINREQYEECAVLCHSIKGLSGMLGLTSLYEHMIKMEDLLKKVTCETQSPEDLSALLSCVSNDIRLVCQLQL